MLLYWILLGLAAAVALTSVVFFFWGLGDGSVSSFNVVLWLTLLGGTAAVLLGGWKLNAAGAAWRRLRGARDPRRGGPVVRAVCGQRLDFAAALEPAAQPVSGPRKFLRKCSIRA